MLVRQSKLQPIDVMCAEIDFHDDLICLQIFFSFIFFSSKLHNISKRNMKKWKSYQTSYINLNTIKIANQILQRNANHGLHVVLNHVK